tara:strand:- start:12784 stop:14199 length:1416 start_codon:yes stop_codon:yes gene_type:complete
MATTDIISEKPDETITQDINSTYKNEPVVTETETETVQPETVVTPSSTTTQPMFSKNERIGYTLLPLASALLQGKRTGGGSMFNDTLASLGQGLMGTTEVALKIKQLEGANKTKASTTRKQYKLQPSAKKVQIGGQIFTPEMGKIISLDDATLAQYPVDTFVEVTKDSKVTSKSIYVEKPFEIDGVKYEIGQREIPQSVINKQLAISPNVFGDAPTEDSDKATFRNYVFLKKKKTFKNKEGKEETKMVNDTSQAYGVFDRGGELFVSVGGELIPQSKLIEEDRLGTLFTKSQFTGLQDRLDVKAFQKLQEKARDNQLKLQAFNDLYRALQDTGEGLTGRLNQIRANIKLKTGQELNDSERAALEKEGALRKLIGQSRLDLFGPGVLTEFEQELAKQALVGNDKFINLEVAKSLLLKAARKGISDYEASLAEVHQQNDIRGQDYQYLDFDFRALPLFADDIIQQKKDDGDKF